MNETLKAMSVIEGRVNQIAVYRRIIKKWRTKDEVSRFSLSASFQHTGNGLSEGYRVNQQNSVSE